MSVRALLIYLCLAAPAFGQGFAGLGTEADGFSVPQPGTAFNFPADHGPHPGYRIEWWYLTANLQAADGTDYGVQWTLFRSALAPVERSGWSSPQLWMGHAGLTTRTHQFVAERLARGGIGQAGVTAAPFAAWIDNWQMAGRALPEADALSALDLRAAGQAFSYELALDAKGPLVPQGVQGYSVKSEKGQASYYYSQPFYHVTGTLTLPAGAIAVTGQAWLDHEWSSQPLAEDQTGWDWFSLAFRQRRKDDGLSPARRRRGLYIGHMDRGRRQAAAAGPRRAKGDAARNGGSRGTQRADPLAGAIAGKRGRCDHAGAEPSKPGWTHAFPIGKARSELRAAMPGAAIWR